MVGESLQGCGQSLHLLMGFSACSFVDGINRHRSPRYGRDNVAGGPRQYMDDVQLTAVASADSRGVGQSRRGSLGEIGGPKDVLQRDTTVT